MSKNMRLSTSQNIPYNAAGRKIKFIALKHGDTLTFDGSSCLAMLQSWLVFGFLEGTYKRRFSSSQYVVDTASGRVVDTTQLRQFFDKWYGLMQREGLRGCCRTGGTQQPGSMSYTLGMRPWKSTAPREPFRHSSIQLSFISSCGSLP